MRGVAPGGMDGGLRTRYIAKEVPYALVLLISIGTVAGLGTAVVDGHIALASAMLGQHFER